MKLHFKKYGENGEPLLILHGLFGSLDNWQSIAKQLSSSFQVYVIDQRNHGKSPHVSPHNYTEMSADLKDFMDEHNIESANILGHSMGGKTVMQFAIEHPQMVDKLIVADIAPKYYPPHHQTIIKALKSVDFSLVQSRKDVDEQISKSIKEEGVKQFLLKNLYWEEKGKLNWKFNLELISKQIENIGEALVGFAYFTNPTLFLKGEHSNYILEEDVDNIDTIFPLSEVVTISNSGHWLHAENPSDFLEEIQSFLN